MDPILKYLNQVAWKFPKGYPDMNDPKDKEMLFEMINNIVTEEEEKATAADGVVSKADIIKVLEDEEFTPEQLQRILSSVSSIKFKDEIINYISSKGKGPAKVATNIYNKMVATGDAPTYAEYLKNMKDYSYLGDAGNLVQKFNFVSQELVDYITALEPSIGRVSTGKGEILLSVMLKDVKDAVSGGDIEAGGREVEVKNKGAVPMGQKAQFGVNTMETVYQKVERDINQKLSNNIEFSDFRGRRPFNRFGLVYAQIAQEEPEFADDFIVALDKALKSEYPGLDFSNIKVSNYVGNLGSSSNQAQSGLDWTKLELDMAKEVVKLYIKSEGFQEVFFLNDLSKTYKRVSTDKLVEMLGNQIKIYFKDGLPRWTYNF